jgi:hypothetical protein
VGVGVAVVVPVVVGMVVRHGELLYYNITGVHALEWRQAGRLAAPRPRHPMTYGAAISRRDAEPPPSSAPQNTASLERGRRRRRPIPAMTENPDPEERPGDPERGNSLRAWLIDALALGMGALAVFHYQPDGFAAALIVFVGAYTLTHSLHGLNWALLATICELLLVWVAPAVHLGTLMMVPTGTGATGLVFTFLLPGVAQAYWLWELWPATGALSHPLTVMCATWLALLEIRVLAQIIFVSRRAPHSPRHHRIQMKPLPKLRRP